MSTDFQFYIKDGIFYSNKPGIPNIRREIEIVLSQEGSKSLSELSETLGFGKSWIGINASRLENFNIVKSTYRLIEGGGINRIISLIRRRSN